jgi:hypothetical protein
MTAVPLVITHVCVGEQSALAMAGPRRNANGRMRNLFMSNFFPRNLREGACVAWRQRYEPVLLLSQRHNWNLTVALSN